MAIKVIKKVSKEKLEDFLQEIDVEDPKLYEELNSGNTLGLFQLDGKLCKTLIEKIKPENFSEVAAVSSLSRPGTIHFLENYIKGKMGQLPNYPKKMLDILKDTYGTILYQEDALRIFNLLGKFTLLEAEEVRGLMKKLSKLEKSQEDLDAWDKVVEKFTKGCLENGINKEEAKKITEDIRGFANYSFNKSHAYSYNLLSFAGIYLSLYFRIHYYTGLLNHEDNSDELFNKLIEIKAHGIEVLPPDINKSKEGFTISNNKIYYGLSSIKNIGTKATNLIVENAPYENFFDFYKKNSGIVVNKRVITSLIKAGAFDGIEKVDRKVLLDIYLEFKENLPNNREPDMFYEKSYINLRYSRPITEDELVEFDKESFGYNFFYSKFMSYNVIKSMKENKGRIYNNINELKISPRRVPLLVNNAKKHIDKNGNEMLFLDCSDINMTKVDLPLFSSIYRFIDLEIEPGEIYYFLLYLREGQPMFYSNRRITGEKNKILITKVS